MNNDTLHAMHRMLLSIIIVVLMLIHVISLKRKIEENKILLVHIQEQLDGFAPILEHTKSKTELLFNRGDIQ